jgi:hypothetical protein
MTDPERQVSRAIDFIRANQSEDAKGILSRIINVEPKPILYWFASAQCWKNDEDLSYSCLRAFAWALEKKRAELLRVDGKTALDFLVEGRDELISLLREEHAEMSDSFSRFQSGDYCEAVNTLDNVIARRIEALKKLGYDVS